VKIKQLTGYYAIRPLEVPFLSEVARFNRQGSRDSVQTMKNEEALRIK